MYCNQITSKPILPVVPVISNFFVICYCLILAECESAFLTHFAAKTAQKH